MQVNIDALSALLSSLADHDVMDSEQADDWLQLITGCRFGLTTKSGVPCGHEDCNKKLKPIQKMLEDLVSLRITDER